MALPPPGGSAPPTPGTYEKVGAVSTLKLVTGTKTVDAVRMTVREKTYGVVFSFTVPKTVYDNLGWQQLASEYAAVVQNYGQFVGTQGILYVQDTNGANELMDRLIVTVGTDDGMVAIDVEVPLDPAQETTGFNKVVAAYDAAIANLVPLG